jgi:PAS domain S-box-containing protein
VADTARADASTGVGRDGILEAVAFAAERFLRASGWRDVADEVLARLGLTVGVSRAYIVENVRRPDGAVHASWVAEWCDVGVAPLLQDASIASAPWLDTWAARMLLGEPVLGRVDELPPDERAALRAHDVVSFASLPVWVGDAWWGSIGFDDCRADRSLDGSALGALRTAASILSAAVERQRRDEQLRDAERRYREFIERIPAVTYTDVPGDVVRMGFVSPQVKGILGYPSAAFLEDPGLWFRLMHPDDRERLNASNAFDAKDLDPFDQEYRMIAADGREVWVHDTSTAVLRDDGEVDYFQGFMVDVTRRKHAEERLREAEERFRVLVEQMPAVIYTQRVEPGTPRVVGVDYVSPQVLSMFGYTPEVWRADAGFWSSIVHDEDRERVVATVQRVHESGHPLSIDYRVVASDGRVVWVHDEAFLIRDGHGLATHWQGYMLDVTERRHAEEQIRVAEERFRTIVEHTPAITYQEVAVASADDSTATIGYVSPQVESILGYTAEECAERNFWTGIMHPDDVDSVLEVGGRATTTGEPYRQDYRMYARDGRVVWFHDEAHLIRDDAGEPLFWQGVMLDITDRKDAEDGLRRAQDRLQALIEHIPAVVYIESPDADPIKFYLSPQVEQIFGYTAEEWTWTEDFWLEHVHPEDRPLVEDADRDSDMTHPEYSTDYRFLRADGRYVWVHDQAIYVPTGDGIGFWQGFLFDITDRKGAEAQLRDAERVLRATVEHLPAVVYREAPDADPNAFYISPQLANVVGYTPAEWTWTPSFWESHIHPDDVDGVLAMNQRANDTKEPYSIDYRFRRPDGTYMWLHDEATFVGDAEDGFWQGFLLDVTERKEAERQLIEAEEQFRTIVEQNPAVIYTQDIDARDPAVSRTTYISPRQYDMFGYSTDEVLSDPTLWSRMVHPDDRERVLTADARSNLTDADDFSLEYRMIARDGRIVWVQDQAQRVRISGREAFWQGFLLDITERKHAQEQLERALVVEREATKRLRALDDMKNTFLQAVSHDLRTPLAAILGLAITLERGDVDLDDDDARDLARRIAENARRLDRLVMNLLDLDRLARGIVTPKLQPTEVGALVRRIVAESELIAGSRLHTDIAAVTASIDGAKLERIVENLLANTARHTPPDASVWVVVRAQDDGVLVKVEDDGPGVAPELRDTIFEPFQQGPDAPRHSPGVGVGLTLVRRFAELHGGRAWVEDREGGGASFRVFLPFKPRPAPGGPDF